MGVKGFYSYLRPYRREIYPQDEDGGVLGALGAPSPSLSDPSAQGKRIGFDAMSILYKYKSNYKEIYPVLTALKAKGYKLLFVFDGKPPVEKEEEVQERREARQNAVNQAATLKEQLVTAELGERERQILEFSVARLEFQGWHMTRDIRHEFQRELWDLEIPYVKGLGEADVVLTDMVAAGKLDIVVSTDMDYLLSGVPKLWIPFRKHADGFEEIILEDVLQGEGLTAEALRDAGILCGVEPLRGKVHINAHTAFSWIRYYKSIEGLLASSVKDPHLQHLQGEGVLNTVRRHFEPQVPWSNRIRPDHFERFKPFLESL